MGQWLYREPQKSQLSQQPHMRTVVRDLVAVDRLGLPVTRPTRPPRTTARRRGRRRLAAPGSLAALLALAVAVSAHAPSVITIRPGDTLWDLAREHGTTVDALRELNGLPGNGLIYAGRTLQLPTGSSSAATAQPASSRPSPGRSHVVRPGETLSHLALRYGTTVAELRRANQLPGTTIHAGRRLTVPGQTGTPPAPATLADVPTHNAGKRIPDSVRSSVAQHRAVLAQRRLPSKAQVRALVAETARRHGVSPSLALAVAYHESGFQQGVVSPVDAIGVMQVLPSTGRALSRQTGRDLDLLDTQDNVTAGVLLLRQLVRSTGSTDKALAGYYQGLRSVAQRGLLPQTQAYIANVNALRPRFA
jgi:LysM repeat protein